MTFNSIRIMLDLKHIKTKTHMHWKNLRKIFKVEQVDRIKNKTRNYQAGTNVANRANPCDFGFLPR